ncbi:MAG TPA: ATP-binding protein, partial [Stackebrandtia sp.]|uniref:sensor histidine kinase n=1 Tax=Stackebrandtia sp. TaxID=2023065 RepID=UPI002D614DCC
MRSRLLWIALVPALVVFVAGGGAIAYILAAKLTLRDSQTLIAIGAAIVVSIVAIAVAISRANATADANRERVDALRTALPRNPEDIQILVDQWQRGERPVSLGALLPPARQDGLEILASDLDRFRQVATAAVTRMTPMSTGEVSPDQRVGVFVNLARRLQSLVHREIKLLDELESQVEDPDLLKGLFAVDHLATRIRRHAENLAVLGGAVSRRQWSRPVNIYAVLRSAVAEVEQYSRVKLVRPIDGNLQGFAVADVIHLVAELVENATRFSPPRTQVLLRVQQVTAGLAVEVEDRGLGLPREEQNRINAMLSEPDQIDIAELLNDGRIGLFVVSTLARRHGIAVQLQTNIYGGTQAVLVLPYALLGNDSDNTEVHQTVPLEAREIEVEPQQPAQPAALEQRPAEIDAQASPMPTRVPAPEPTAPPAPMP